MQKYYKKLAIACAAESAYATDAAPTGALNAMLARNVKIAPIKLQKEQRELVYPYLGNDDSIVSAFWSGISFDIEAAGSGTAGTAPPYSALLRACGMAGVVTAGSKVTYSRVSGGFESASLYADLDGILHKMVGMRGSPKLTFTYRKAPLWTFDMQAIFVPLVDGNITGAVYDAFKEPLAVNKANTPTFNLFGVNGLVMYEAAFDWGNQVEYRNPVNYEGVDIVDSKPVGSVKFEATTVAAKNWVNAVRDGEKGALALVHGMVAGNIIAVNAPKVKLGEISNDNESGIVVYSTPTEYMPNGGSGNNEISVEFR